MKKVLSTVLSAVMITALAACGAPAAGTTAAGTTSAGTTAASTEAIKIGGLAPLTGQVSVYGIAASNGVKMAIDELNAKGGINGRQIDFILLDEKGDQTEAVNAYTQLLDKGIVALIGDVTSKPTIAVAERAKEDNMPMITATGTNPAITKVGENVFRACFTDPSQGVIMANFASAKLNAKKVAVLYNTSDDYSAGIADSFKTQSGVKGMEVTSYEGYGADDTDFKTQLTNIIAKNPEAIMVPDYYNTVALITKQARDLGYKGAFLGGDGWDGVLTVVDATNVAILDNSYYSNHYFKDDPAEALQNFLKGYKEKFNMEANSFAALGYDAAMLMAQAIKEAGTTDKQAIIDAMKNIDFKGITGDIKFDANRDPLKTTSVIKIEGGKESLSDKIAN